MEKQKTKTIHWRVPTIILAGLLLGSAFALGHHYYYNSLHGRAVLQVNPTQEWNLRIGTGFTFLVRCSLAMSVGTSYWQLFWLVVLNRTLSLAHLDILAGLTTGMSDLLQSFPAVRLNPSLLLMGLIIWTLPLAFIVPPATLTVVSTEVSQSAMRQVPLPDWQRSWTSASYARELDDRSTVYYMGPQIQLNRILTSTALLGEIPSWHGPQNVSYTITFPGPRIKCQQASPDILRPFNEVAKCNVTGPYRLPSCAWWYLSWTPCQSNLVPFSKGSMSANKTGLPMPTNKSQTLGQGMYLGDYQSGPATVFVATTRMSTSEATAQHAKTKEVAAWQVTNCTLWNATYTVDVRRRNVGQDLTVTSMDTHNPVAIQDHRHRNDTSTAQQWNYQAMMESLGKILVGSIFYYNGTGDAVRSNMALQTELAFTGEMRRIYDLAEGNKEDRDHFFPSHQEQYLADATEELFRNMTLALFSSPFYLTNSTSLTNVTQHEWHNVYSFSASQLWLSYGLAIGATLIGALFGSVALLQNQASYSNKPSTMLRVGAGQDDQTGADPLPTSLGKRKVDLGSRRAFELLGTADGHENDLPESTPAQDSLFRRVSVGVINHRGYEALSGS